MPLRRLTDDSPPPLGDRVKLAFAEPLNDEAPTPEGDGIGVIRFDEPAFNVYMKEAADWGALALERATKGLARETAGHICYGYGIPANVDGKATFGQE